MQFHRFDLVDEKMSERDFAESLVAYAGYNVKRRAKMLKKVKKAFKDEQVVSISWFIFICDIVFRDCRRPI